MHCESLRSCCGRGRERRALLLLCSISELLSVDARAIACAALPMLDVEALPVLCH